MVDIHIDTDKIVDEVIEKLKARGETEIHIHHYYHYHTHPAPAPVIQPWQPVRPWKLPVYPWNEEPYRITWGDQPLYGNYQVILTTSDHTVPMNKNVSNLLRDEMNKQVINNK